VDMRVVPGGRRVILPLTLSFFVVSVEASAKYIHDTISPWLAGMHAAPHIHSGATFHAAVPDLYGDRCWVESVEVKENEKNSGIYRVSPNVHS
jgi:hypothetical protein